MHNRQAAHITVTSLDAHRLRRLLDAAADSLDHEHFEGLEEGQEREQDDEVEDEVAKGLDNGSFRPGNALC